MHRRDVSANSIAAWSSVPRVCTICTHPEREAINQALVAGEVVKTRCCVDCGLEKPRSGFSAANWKGWQRQPVCIPCTDRRLARLEQWHAAQAAERTERLRLAAEFQARRDAEYASFLARVPATVRRRRQAQYAIEQWRPAVIARDGYVCGICGDLVCPTELSIDHIIPVARGGGDDLDNLQVAHRVCNSRKGARYAT
jgi:hypothetical protein